MPALAATYLLPRTIRGSERSARADNELRTPPVQLRATARNTRAPRVTLLQFLARLADTPSFARPDRPRRACCRSKLHRVVYSSVGLLLRRDVCVAWKNKRYLQCVAL